MKKLNKKWLVVVLAVVILGAVAAGVAVAASSSTPGSLQSRSQAFMSNLASALNISPGALTTAMKTASTQTVNQELASGQITQTQATQMLSRINSGQSFFMGMGPFNRGSVSGSVYGTRGFRMGGGGGFMILKPAASALGMTPQALITALKSGQTISSLAAAKSLTVASLESTISASIQSQLQTQVANGKLTQSQETQIYNKLEQNISSGNWITQLQNAGKGGHHRQAGGQQTAQS